MKYHKSLTVKDCNEGMLCIIVLLFGQLWQCSLWCQPWITSDKTEEKQSRNTAWASLMKTERVGQPADRPSGCICVCWWSDKSDSPQLCWSTASVGHLSELTSNSRRPLHSMQLHAAGSHLTGGIIIDSPATVTGQLVLHVCVGVGVYLQGKT